MINNIIPNKLGDISTKNIEIRINKIVLEMINMQIDPITGFIYHSFYPQEPIKSEGRILRLELGKKPKGIETETFSPLWRFGHAEILLSLCVVEYNVLMTGGDLDEDISDDPHSAEDYFVITDGPVDPVSGKVLTICSIMQRIDPTVSIGQATHTSKAVSAVMAIIDYLHESTIIGKAKANSVVNDIQLMLNLIESEKIRPTKKNAEAERLASNRALVNSQANDHMHIRHDIDAPAVIKNQVSQNNNTSMYDKMKQRVVNNDAPVAVIRRDSTKIVANTRKAANNLSTGVHTSKKILNTESQYYGLKNVTPNPNTKVPHNNHHNPHINHHQPYNLHHPKPQGQHKHIVHSWDD